MLSLRAAVVGLGFVGKAHAEALRRLGVGIRGVLDQTPDLSKVAAEAAGAARSYATMQELLEDEAVDVVHVCTPNYLHFEQARAVLSSGKHVICEKPLAMDARQAADLVELARATKKVGAVCYNLRYYPLCHQARALIREGAIGASRLVHGSYLQDWLLLPTDWNWRLDPDLGGAQRAVTDIGTHWLDLAMWLTGQRVVRVCADLATLLAVRQKPRREIATFEGKLRAEEAREDVAIHTEDYGSVLLQFDRGLRGVMTVSQVSAGRKNRLWMEVDGSNGSLAWNSETPNQLWVGHRERPNEILIKDPALMSSSVRSCAAYPGGHAEGYPDTFLQLFRQFYHYLAAGDLDADRPFPTFETGYEAVRLCEAIAKSAKDQAWVDLSA